ncbi:MAG: LamG domain-containing protein, partial [archaeon]
TNTAATGGSVYVDTTLSYPKTGMIVEFDYKCESGILWGMMFYDGGGWGCIQGSGTANCGAAYSAGGSFSPAIVCDNTWRHANYSINWAGATMYYPIIGDWGSSNTPNKRLWFDNFVIRKPKTYTTGKYGQGMEFDGIGDYISIPQTFYNSETFSLWVKTTKTGPLMTWSQGDLAGYYDRTITINSAATANVSWYIWNKATIYSDKNVNDGNWHHIATTGNATSMNIYIDGVLSSSRVADSRSDATLDTHITIGGGAAGYFNGTIDEVRVWNRSLSASEIYQLYISNLYKFNSSQWYLYMNQSKNATAGLDLGLYTYQTFATNSSGNIGSTEQRTIDISPSICPSSKRNWNINLAENYLINSLCNLTGYNVTFTGTGNLTVNNPFYFNEMNNLSSGMTIWIKPNGILYSGAT